MNILVIAPHPDDESIGCGGAICDHASRGDYVAVGFLTSGEAGLTDLPSEQARRLREREGKRAAAILGVGSVSFLRQPDGHLSEDAEQTEALLRPILERERPDLIYLPHEHDWHPDHRVCLQIVRAALRNYRFTPPTLLCYEVLTPLTEYDRVEDITPFMDRKLRAVRAHRSQVRQLRYDCAARALNEYRGAVTEVGGFAEAFAVPNLTAVSRDRRADPSWHRIHRIADEITNLVPADDSFILVDEDRLNAQSLVSPRRCIPFLERSGSYWGKPADDDSAIRELDRLRCAGASFIVFAWPALWWLQHYSGLAHHLYSCFSCVRSNSFTVAFDLREQTKSCSREHLCES